MEDCAIAPEGGGYVDFAGEDVGCGGGVDGEGEGFVELGGYFGFEYEGDVGVIGMDMAVLLVLGTEGIGRETYLAYSIRDPVTWGAFSFLIIKMFRGGEGH